MTTLTPPPASASDIFFHFVAPTIGCLIASSLFAAPIHDLRKCLQRGTLGHLNPYPWAFMTGNTFGWIFYGYLKHDPFLVASNLPGLILSLWLNMGASKLQYVSQMSQFSSQYQQHPRWQQQSLRHSQQQQQQQLDSHDESDNDNGMKNSCNNNSLIYTPQDVWFLRVVVSWAVVLVVVGWLGVPQLWGQAAVGMLVNSNLLVFYAAPLSTMWTVIQTKSSDSIHTPTILLNCGNAAFWFLYGVAQNDVVIWGPNGLGLTLGAAQAMLCLYYPKTTTSKATSRIIKEIEFQQIRTTDEDLDDVNIVAANDGILADASDMNDDDDFFSGGTPPSTL